MQDMIEKRLRQAAHPLPAAVRQLQPGHPARRQVLRHQGRPALERGGLRRPLEYREWDRDLHPGDIVLTHFRGKEDWKGTMPDMIRRVMKTVTDKGYAVARLEDYV